MFNKQIGYAFKTKKPDEKIGEWYYTGKALVLICDHNLHYKGFHDGTRGKHGVASCIIACIFTKLHSEWKREHLKEILNHGARLYEKTVVLLGHKCPNIRIKPGQFQNNIFINYHKIFYKIQREKLGKLGNLEEDLGEFLGYHQYCLLQSKTHIFTIFKHQKFWVIFNPDEHEKDGTIWKGLPKFGHSALLVYKKYHDLIDYLLEFLGKNCAQKIRYHSFNITRMWCFDEKPLENVDDYTKTGTKPINDCGTNLSMEVPTLLSDPNDTSIKILKKKKVKKESLVQEPPEMVPIENRVIPEGRPVPVPKTPFTSINDNIEILRGTIAMDNSNLPQSPESTLYLAYGLSAIIMQMWYPSNKWVPNIVDKILTKGLELLRDYLICMKTLNPITVSESLKRVPFMNKFYTINFDELTMISALISDNDLVPEIQIALDTFFKRYDRGMIVGTLTYATWYHDKWYYLYIPNRQNDQGLPVDDNTTTIGTCCVLRFGTTYLLGTFYKKLALKRCKNEKIIISRIEIQDYIDKPEPWYQFQSIDLNKWILRGTINQGDHRFDSESRDTQCTAMAALALIMNEIIDGTHQWTTNLIDEVLVLGDGYYKDCIESLQNDDKFIEPMLMVDELKRNLIIKNYLINLEITDCLINGLVNSTGEVPDLKKGLEEFFKENNTGIMTSHNLSLAIWRYQNGYHFYDSHSRDENGLPTGLGTACIIRTNCLNNFVNAIKSNLKPSSDDQYNLSRIEIDLIEMTDDGVPQPPNKAYDPIGPNVAILRGRLDENHRKFDLFRGLTTVPNCIVAICMAKLQAPADWVPSIHTMVLEMGLDLYKRSRLELEKLWDDEMEDTTINLDNILTDCRIGGVRFKIECELVLEGTIEDNFENFTWNDNEEWNDMIFETNDRNLIVAILKDEASFYIYDPRARDVDGTIFGKDDWSAKLTPPIETEDEEEEEEMEEEMMEPNGGSGDYIEGMGTTRKFNETNTEEEQEQEEECLEEEIKVVPKMGSNYWRQMSEEKGRCCMIKFNRFSDLLEHILENTPPNQRENITFKITAIKTEPEPVEPDETIISESDDIELIGDWNDFKEMEPGFWILRGTKNCMNLEYPECNRGNQMVPQCFAFIAYFELFLIEKFKPKTIDTILNYGDRFLSFMRRLCENELIKNPQVPLKLSEIKDLVCRKQFGITDYVRSFCISDYRCNIQVVPNVVLGDLTAEPNNETVKNLSDALEMFFEKNYQYALVEAKGTHVVLCQKNDYFYMFDSQSRGPTGRTTTDGVACVTRFQNHKPMTHLFVENLKSTIGSNTFYIHGITLEIDLCPRKQVPKPESPIYSTMTGYTQISDGKYILRGTTAIDDGTMESAAAIAVMALCMVLLNKTSTWTRKIIDETIRLGTKLYGTSIDELGYNFNPWEERFDVYKIRNRFKIGNMDASVEMGKLDQKGLVDNSYNKQYQNLREGIEKFFMENRQGVLMLDSTIVALWEEEEDDGTNGTCQDVPIYLFDSNRRGLTGLPKNDGTACVIKLLNPKMIVDHLLSCGIKKDEQYVITPVDVIVGEHRCHCTKSNGTTMNGTNITTTPNQSSSCSKSENKTKDRLLRNMMIEERIKRENKCLNDLGKFGFHDISDTLAIVRGTHSQYGTHYPVEARGYQTIPNNFVAFVLSKMVPLDQWQCVHIDMVLDAGNQLYLDSYLTYQSNITDDFLGTQNVLRRFYVDKTEVLIKVYQPTWYHDLGTDNLTFILDMLFHEEPYLCFVHANQYLSIFFYKQQFYLFSPYDHQINGDRTMYGFACLFKFQNVQTMAEFIIKNFAWYHQSTDYQLFTMIIDKIC